MNQSLSSGRIFPVILVAIGLSGANAQTSRPTQQVPHASENQPSDQDTRVPNDNPGSSSVELERAIQEAIQQEPTLANANIQVKVTEKEVELSGVAPSQDGKRTALRIALAYAGGRPVKGGGIRVNRTRDQPNPRLDLTRR